MYILIHETGPGTDISKHRSSSSSDAAKKTKKQSTPMRPARGDVQGKAAATVPNARVDL